MEEEEIHSSKRVTTNQPQEVFIEMRSSPPMKQLRMCAFVSMQALLTATLLMAVELRTPVHSQPDRKLKFKG